MKKSLKAFSVFLFSLCAVFSANAFDRIISPANGSFANRQSLVIDLSDGAEAFYSLTNSDPLSSGFAYDGPVLIDSDGDVELFVATVKDGRVEHYEIKYSVDEQNPFRSATSEGEFISGILSEPALVITGSQKLEIPQTLFYSFGDENFPFLKGTVLSVSDENSLSRYIPCSVSDGKLLWRFVILLSAEENSGFSKNFSKPVPFVIEDWSMFRFTDPRYIWKIDGGQWSSSDETFSVERISEHTVFWKSADSSSETPMEYFVLAPKPVLKTESINGLARFSIEGDVNYRMQLVSAGIPGENRSSSEGTGGSRQLAFDVFSGDSIKSDAVFALYSDGVFQGTLSCAYSVDRKPPVPPVFSADSEGLFARSDILLDIGCESDCEVFYSVAGPHKVENGSYTSELDFVRSVEYKPFNGEQIYLPAGRNSAVFYRVCAYAADAAGNLSEVSEYKVIIDEYNYFIDAKSSSVKADGSRENPYKTFSQVVDVINSGKFSHFYVSGTLVLPPEKIEVLSNCSFTGLKNAKILFSENSSILLKNSSMDFDSLILEKQTIDEKKSDPAFFILENSAIAFSECEIFGNFATSGIVVESLASVVDFSNCSVTVLGKSYACGISAESSEITVSDSYFASIAASSVNFSLEESSLDLASSDCRVICSLGRIVESSASNLKLNGNTFTAEFEKNSKKISPVWKDSESLVLEYKNNISKGF